MTERPKYKTTAWVENGIRIGVEEEGQIREGDKEREIEGARKREIEKDRERERER